MSPIKRSPSRKRRGKSPADAEWRAPRPEPLAPEPPLHPVLQLQRDVGNQTTQQLIASGAPPTPSPASPSADAAETEADQIADHIMRSQPGSPAAPIPANSSASNSGSVRGSAGDLDNALQSSGQPLDHQTRAFFEPKFGQDLDDVRVHTGTDADQSARSVRARAYATGDHIVFGSGAYAPHSPDGQRLIAHELTHVLQQRSGVARGIQRSPNPAPAAPPQPATIQDTAADEDRWRVRVDQAVRTQFNLRGAGVERSNVRFLDLPQFAAQFPAPDLPEKLFTIFFNYGQAWSGMPATILDYNHHPFHLAGPTSSTLSQLRTFIQDGITRGYFEGQTREYDVTTGRRFPPFRVTPRELVAAYIGGITDIGTTRANRKITMRMAGGTADVDTLVHETCHFYVSDAFRDMVTARPDKNDFLGGSWISQILLEGFAEYFARQVMVANASTFGPPANSYPAEVEQVHRLVATLGENSVRAAYFGGDARQIQRVRAAIDEYKITPEDLLVPGFVIDARIAGGTGQPGNKP